MTYQDQRNEEHPEAVRSEPVPVQRSGAEDDAGYHDSVDRPADVDADRDGVDDRVEETDLRDNDGDLRDNDNDLRANDDDLRDDVTRDDVTRDDVTSDYDATRDDATRDDVTSDDVTSGYDARDNELHDGAIRDDETRDAEVREDEHGADDVRDQDDVYQAAEDERTGYDDPVVASPVDTDAERTGVDDVDLDRDRTDDQHGPTFPDSALTPAAFGAGAAGGAAAAAAMAANRTDTRTDVETVDDRDDHLADADADHDHLTAADDDDHDRFGDVTDRVAEADERTELMPGEVTAEPVTALVAVEAAQGFRDRWREVQLRFVDDPRGATAEAQALAEEAADALVEALATMRSDLGGWEANQGGDTEHLRVAVRRYRDFLDRMLQS
jgi:hypothetical protein